MTKKRCTHCILLLPASEFGLSRYRSKLGLRPLCRSCERVKRSDWVLANYSKAREADRLHKAKRDPATVREEYNRWFKKNYTVARARLTALSAARRVVARSPLSKIHSREIVALYVKAAARTEETGVKHEVDHIIPINGRGVCGLHVPWNMRVVTMTENRQKGNKVECVL